MSKISGLDVPPELLNDFYSAVKLIGLESVGRIDSKNILQSRELLRLLTAAQGEKVWVDFYKLLTSDQKATWRTSARAASTTPQKACVISNSLRAALELAPLYSAPPYYLDFIFYATIVAPAASMHLKLTREDFVKFPVSLLKFPDKYFIKVAPVVVGEYDKFAFSFATGLSAYGSPPSCVLTFSVSGISNGTAYTRSKAYSLALSSGWARNEISMQNLRYTSYDCTISGANWSRTDTRFFHHDVGSGAPIDLNYDFVAGLEYYVHVSPWFSGSPAFHVNAAGYINADIPAGSYGWWQFVAVSSAHLQVTLASTFHGTMQIFIRVVGTFTKFDVDLALANVRGYLALDNISFNSPYDISLSRNFAPYKIDFIPMDAGCNFVKTENLPAGCSELWQELSLPSGADYDRVYLDYEEP